jgi:predicted glycogen debranching enzyme
MKLIRTIEDPCTSIEASSEHSPGDAEELREWLITNGLGGYASGTVCGVPTRGYHGLLIAALATPLGRTMMLNQLHERVQYDGEEFALVPEALAGRPVRAANTRIVRFRLEMGLPVWEYQAGAVTLEKRLVVPHLQNTIMMSYRMVGGGEGRKLRLQLRPLVHFRSHNASVNSIHPGPYRFTAWSDRYEISTGDDHPPLRLTLQGTEAAFTLDAARTAEILYLLEAQRGYQAIGDLWSPGFFHVEMAGAAPVTLVASVESWETLLAMSFDEAQRAERERRSRLIAVVRRAGPADPAGQDGDPLPEELVLAADQFLITPSGRVKDAARAHAAGEEVRTVIAGYH